MSILSLKQIYELTAESTGKISLPAKGEQGFSLSTGYFGLDQILGGLISGKVYLIAGRPSMGKTTLLLNLAANLLKSCENPILYISPREEISSLANRLKPIWEAINESMDEKTTPDDCDHSSASLYFDNLNYFDSRQVISSFDAMILAWKNSDLGQKSRVSDKGFQGLIILEDIEHICHERTKNRTLDRIEAFLKELGRVASSYNIPIIVSSTTGRDIERRINKRPLVKDLRWNASCLKRIDRFVLVYRDEVYRQNLNNKNLLELQITDNRNGAADSFLLTRSSNSFKLKEASSVRSAKYWASWDNLTP